MMSPSETVPVLNLRPQDVDNLLEELQASHAISSPLLQRREQRQWSADYLRGLLLEIPRKSIAPRLLALHGAAHNAIRAMQPFVGEGAWPDDALLKRHWGAVAAPLGDEDGVWTLDGSDFLNPGKASVGVKRQDCGEVGKRAHCPVGVLLSSASSAGSTLLDRRLYLPRAWVEDDAFAERRAQCGVPHAIRFQTKPDLGWEMMREGVADPHVRARGVACAAAFGRDSAWLDNVARSGLWYFAEVPHATRVWIARPLTGVPAWSGRGRKPTRERLVAGQPGAQTVQAIAAQVLPTHGQRHGIKAGSKGPMAAAFWALRVVTVRDGVPGPAVWLVLRRQRETGELKTYLCNAPSHSSRSTRARLRGLRWPIETCVEERTQSLGMGDDAGRSWRGWHHHMTRWLLAHLFWVRQQQRGKKT